MSPRRLALGRRLAPALAMVMVASMLATSGAQSAPARPASTASPLAAPAATTASPVATATASPTAMASPAATAAASPAATPVLTPTPKGYDVTIGSADGRATVPFSLVANHIYLDGVYLDGQGPFRFILDSGGSFLLSPALADRIGVPATDGATGRVDVVRIGEVAMHRATYAVLPIDKILLSGDGVRADGMLGSELLERLVTRIDYQHTSITFASPGATAPVAGPGIEVPLIERYDKIYVRADVDGTSGTYLVDTGNRGSLDLYSPRVFAGGLAAKYRATVHGIIGFGIGGALHGFVARAARLTIGPVVVTDPVLYLSTDRTGIFSDPRIAGNIGGGVLRRFTVTLDYGRKTMRLDPNATDALPDVDDRSGLVVSDVGGEFRIVDVRTHTPAAAAGVPNGVVLGSLNGLDARSLTLEEIRERLRAAPGTRVTIEVDFNGIRVPYTFALRDLEPEPARDRKRVAGATL